MREIERLGVWAGYIVAALLAAMSLAGLTMDATYARETPNWIGQALAQDWFDLVVAVPAIAIASWCAGRGSWRGRVVLAGGLLFAVYTLAIYCFAVHLNALFLLYCATFGVALYGLIAVTASVLTTPRPVMAARRAPAAMQLVVGVAFAALWLSQLVPAALTGEPPRELVETGLATNPVHVLDLAFVLPLHLIAGVALLRRRPLGYVLAPAVLAFGALMAGTIAFLSAYLDVRGIAAGGMPVAGVMGLGAVASAGRGVGVGAVGVGSRGLVVAMLGGGAGTRRAFRGTGAGTSRRGDTLGARA